MSGSCVKSGMLSNKGSKLSNEEVNDILGSIIVGLSIQVIPLVQNSGVTAARNFGKFFQQFIHPKIFSPTLSHIAIHLTLVDGLFKPNFESGKVYNVVLEYGQYYSNESEEIKNSNGSQICRINNNNLKYYYINQDGARITIFRDEDFDYFANIDENENIKIFGSDFFPSPCFLLWQVIIMELLLKNV